MRKVNLFWTGGWDSSFALCQLLLVHGFIVKPYYMLDGNRNSMARELKAMDEMKEYLFENFPKTRKLLLPTNYFNVKDIMSDDLIQNTYKRVKSRNHFGKQYNWLARFCKENGINDMHMSLEKPTKPRPNHFLYKLIDKMDIRMNSDHQVYVLKNDYIGQDIHTLIRYYHFPILNLSKFDMYEIAKKNKWIGVMSLTWFCFSPSSNGNVCGRCISCQQRVKEGFYWRFPIHRRLITRLYLPYKKFIKPVKLMIQKSIK